MGKFDLQPSNNRRSSVTEVLDVEVLSPSNQSSNSSKLSSRDISAIVDGGVNTAQATMGLAKIIVETQAKIGIIRAETEQKIAVIDGEIRKIVESTEAKIKELKTSGDEWRKNFSEKKRIVDDCLIQLNSHPEYSDDIKKAIIELATKSLESN